jgi:CRP-like cAMP-binding protein
MAQPNATDRKLLTQFLTAVCPFPPEQLESVLGRFELRDFKTGWRFSEEGEPCEYFGLVLKGIFKLERHTLEGRHYIVDFSSEGALVGNYTAWVLKGPADLTIEALEEGRVAMLRTRHHEDLFQAVPVWNEFVRRLLERELIRLADRERHLLSFDARQRYEVFVAARPHQLGRLLGKDIAAYLGITPVSLSRLAAKRRRKTRPAEKIEAPTLERARGPRLNG